MAFDAEEVALRARERITEMSETDVGFTPGRLMVFIPDARQALTELLAAENDGRFVYTKTFEVECAAGVADLSTVVDAEEPLMLDDNAFSQAKVYIDGYTNQLRIFPDRTGLQLDPGKTPACAVEDQNLYIKNAAGKLNTYASPVRVSSPYVPSLEHIRRADQRKLIDLVATIALASLKQPPKRSAPRSAPAAA